MKALLAWVSPLLLATTVIGASPPTWQRLAGLPVGNGGFVAAAIDGRIVIAGGTTWQGDTKLWLDRIWAYEPARDAWSETGRLPVPVAYPASGVAGRTLWFAGGSGGGAAHPSVWKLASITQAVEAVPFRQASVYAVGGVIGGKFYTVGGSDDQAAVARLTNHLFSTDLTTGAVERLADYPEASISNAGAAVLGDHLYVFGGGYWDAARQGVFNHASAHAYATATGRWEKLPSLPHAGRGFSAIDLDDRHILVAGGYRNDQVEFVADAYLFDTQTRRYRPTLPLPYTAMVALVRDGEWLYCLGGEDRKRHRTDAAFRIRCAELLR